MTELLSFQMDADTDDKMSDTLKTSKVDSEKAIMDNKTKLVFF